MTPEEVRAARQRLGLNQTKMGEALGLTRMQIWRLETGAAPAQKQTELAIKYLLKETGNDRPDAN